MLNLTINHFVITLRTALTVAILATLSGCSMSHLVTRESSNTRPPRALKAPIQVIDRGAYSQQPVQILGKIFVERTIAVWETGNQNRGIYNMLRTAARDLGAEAIIDAHAYDGRGSYTSLHKRWGGGLAVVFADTGIPKKAADFVVVVPAMTGFPFGQHQAIREQVQYELEKKGFYAMVSDDSLSVGILTQPSDTELTITGQHLASYVMLIDYILTLPGTQDHVVKAALVSTDRRSVVWRNEVYLYTGVKTSPVEEDVLHVPTNMRIIQGIKKLMFPLPDYTASRY